MQTRSSTPASEYFSAKSNLDGQSSEDDEQQLLVDNDDDQGELVACEAESMYNENENENENEDEGVDADDELSVPQLASLHSGDGRQRSIRVSKNEKRSHKDKRIYVNTRTGLPVRPPTSFGLFLHALRREAKGGKVEFKQFHQKAIKAWNKLSDEEKSQYAERAKVLSSQYKKIEATYLRKKVRQLQRQIQAVRRTFRA